MDTLFLQYVPFICIHTNTHTVLLTHSQSRHTEMDSTCTALTHHQQCFCCILDFSVTSGLVVRLRQCEGFWCSLLIDWLSIWHMAREVRSWVARNRESVSSEHFAPAWAGYSVNPANHSAVYVFVSVESYRQMVEMHMTLRVEFDLEIADLLEGVIVC